MVSKENSQFLNKHLLVLALSGLFILASERFALLDSSLAIGQAPVEGERKAEIMSSRQVPVVVSAVRNLQKEDWLKDMEIEVQNNSGKPIYHLKLNIIFPDIPKTTEVDGRPRGIAMTLTYGRHELMQAGVYSSPDDVPIRPSEKYIFRIPEPLAEGLKSHLIKNNLQESIIKRVMIRIPTLSFGDGTGFVDEAPFSRKQSSKTYTFPENKREANSGIRLSLMKTLLPKNSSNISTPFRDNRVLKTAIVPQYSCGPPLSGCRLMEEVEYTCITGTACRTHFYRTSSRWKLYGSDF